MNKLELPLVINGQFAKSDSIKMLTSFDGEPFATLYGATNAQIRTVRRAIAKQVAELRTIPIEDVVKLIKSSMKYYFINESDATDLAILTGAPRRFISESIEFMKSWALECEQYLQAVFGKVDYQYQAVCDSNKDFAYRIYQSKGPIVALLPQNGYAGEALFVALNSLLSRSPIIIKPSSNQAASLPVLQLINALRMAAQDLSHSNFARLVNSIHVLNVFQNDTSSNGPTINDLFASGDQLIVFGSQDTVRALSSVNGQTIHFSNIIQFGTGLSVSMVFDNCDLNLAVKENAVAVSEDRGNQCHSTNVIYVQNDIADNFIALLKKELNTIEIGNPCDHQTLTGKIHHASLEQIDTHYKRLFGAKASTSDVNSWKSPICIEVNLDDPIEEISAPVVAIKRFNEISCVLNQFRKDLKRNGLNRNLSTSVFTTNEAFAKEIAFSMPSRNVKRNKGTGRLNLMLEHDGKYLIKELLKKIVLE